MSTTVYFSLPGITCVMCAAPIIAALTKCKEALQIESFHVDHDEQTLKVVMKDAQFSSEKLSKSVCKALDNIGVECAIKLVNVSVRAVKESSFKKLFHMHWLWGLIGTGTGVAFLSLSLALGILPLGAMITMASISMPLTLLLGAESYKEAATKLFKTGALTMDALFAISTLTVIVVSISAFFFPWLPMMLDAGLLIFGFRHIGLAIEESIKKTIGIRTTFKDRLPSHVNRVNGDFPGKTALKEIQPGDILLINPPDILPVDGFSMVDESAVLETIITGSTLPRRVVLGEPLLAGMYVAPHAGPLRIRVSAVGRQSYLSKLDDHILSANGEKAPLETATNRILQYFIPAVLIFSLLSLGLISYFFSFSLAIGCAVSVLVSACPCTLGFITPLAVKIGMKKAAEHGVQFKSAKHLQEAEQIDSVVFDLHGTLTKGVPKVSSCGVMPEIQLSRYELLSHFYALEAISLHPMAKAICKYVKDDFNKLGTALPVAEDIQRDTSNHSGLVGFIDGMEYVLGNQKMMDNQRVDMQHVEHNLPIIEVGDSVIYLARAKKVIGYVILTDPLRDDALHVVNALKLLKKKVYLCTGADEATATRYAKKLGIPTKNTYAGCVGSDIVPSLRNKKAFIKQLKKEGHRVAMIGDAANDAVAVAASDFGIAIKSNDGDEITQQQAGAVIQNGSLLPVVGAFAVAQQTVNNIKQNLVASVVYNTLTMLIAGGLLLAINVVINPGIGVALMILQTSLILLNAYRFKKQGLPHLKQKSDEEHYPTTSSHQRLAASMPTPKAGLKAASKMDKKFHNPSMPSCGKKATSFTQRYGKERISPSKAWPIHERVVPDDVLDCDLYTSCV